MYFFDRELNHRVLVHMEGTAHIDFSRFETTEAINVKILPVMQMLKCDFSPNLEVIA